MIDVVAVSYVLRSSAWAREMLHAMLADTTVLVTNSELAVEVCPPSAAVFRYHEAGTILDRSGKAVRRWDPDGVPTTRNKAVWAARMLHRDRVMIRHAAKRAREGQDVALHAFTAPWDKAAAMEMILARGKHAGLLTFRYACQR